MGIGTSAFRMLAGSLLVGAASGYLSQVGVATVLRATPESRLPGFARSPWAKRLSLASAGGEMIANAHFSFLPSRKSPGPLFGRIMFGAGSAALLAHNRSNSLVVPAIAGGVSAAMAANVASDSRAVLTRHVPDPLVGCAENALAIGLSLAATRG